MSKDTKTKLEQLNKLLNAASSEAIRWGEQEGYDTDKYSGDSKYLDYREVCFKKIETVWWKIARSLGICSSDHRTYESAEQNMRDSLSDYEDDNPDWFLNVVEEMELD